MKPVALPALVLPLLVACHSQEPGSAAKTEAAPAYQPDPLTDPRETHLQDIVQLTFAGENAEGYFDSTGTKLVFQAREGDTGFDCDQIFELDLATRQRRLVSTGQGRTTCAYYHDQDRRILYASTHLGGPKCPAEPDRSQGYVWALYPSYDIFSVSVRDPRDLVRLTSAPGYDAEATVDPASGRIVFTSARDGDLELYTMNGDGSDVRRITNRVGYDGGAFFSADGKQIVWRAQLPPTDEAKRDFRELLARGLVRPSQLDVWVADADGGNARQVTHHGKASFAPFFFPNGKRIIYASNLSQDGRTFQLYAVDTDGQNHEQITYSSRFNSFPMFSPDGTHLVFASNRQNKQPNDTNLFLARWVD